MQGRARDQVDVKGQLSYLPPTKAPPTSRQTYNPTAPWGVLSPSLASTLVGCVRGMNTFGGILCKYSPCAICGIAVWVGWYICK